MNQIKRIIIEGEKVHHVGYRPFLLWKVRELGIPNHDARNVKENGIERVVVSVAGEENQLRKFVEFVKKSYPENARVSRVWEDPKTPDTVMPIDEYQKVLDSEQHNTMVQTGLVMIDMQKQTIEEVKIVGEKIDHGFSKMDQNFSRMDTKYDKVSDTMDSIDKTLKELTKAILKLAEKSAR